MQQDTQGLSRGTNQSGGRLYNERLVLSIVRHQDGLPKSEIARLTGLSAQTISVIMQQLEADQLIVKGEPQRGKVGQPSVPFSLNPQGAYSIGLKIGRHRSELVLMDFVGTILKRHETSYRYPVTTELLAFVAKHTPQLIQTLPANQRARVTGIGIATPFELWNWGEAVGAPPDIMNAWKGFDIEQQMGQVAKLPAYLQNDATAACAAELTFGNTQQHDDFLYLYIGYFIGGGVVLNGSVFEGPTRNAGAIGMLPVGSRQGDNSTPAASKQLLQDSSKISLQRMLEQAGSDGQAIWDRDNDWSTLENTVSQWVDQVASDLAHAVISATSIIDFPAIVIDGDMPAAIRKRIVAAVTEKLTDVNTQGLSPVSILEGSLGSDARILGGASLPLLANFIRDRNIAFNGT